MEDRIDLDQAIGTLYQVFAQYRARHDMSHCYHCVSQNDISKLLAIPLKVLSLENLDKYLWKAMTTWGEVEDFKHFLPRILELTPTIDDSDVFIIGSKLEYAHFDNWPELERKAVTDFLQIWWNQELSQFPPDGHLWDCPCARSDDCLQCLSSATKDVRTFLEIWQKNPHVSAVRHLSHFILEHVESLTSNKELNWDTPWRESIEPKKQVIAFLLDDRTLKKLETAFFSYSNALFAFEFSEAVKKLEWIRSVFSTNPN
jgi:hypothetical protein